MKILTLSTTELIDLADLLNQVSMDTIDLRDPGNMSDDELDFIVERCVLIRTALCLAKGEGRDEAEVRALEVFYNAVIINEES